MELDSKKFLEIIREELESYLLLSEAKKPWNPKTMGGRCAEDDVGKHPVCGSPTRGNQFEAVIVARILGLDARTKKDDDIEEANKNTHCGTLYYNCKHKGKKLVDLADEAIAKMTAALGTMKSASVNTGGEGLSGDPKTDIFAFDDAGKQYQISVKLPGGIQLASPEGRRTANDIKNAFNLYKAELGKQWKSHLKKKNISKEPIAKGIKKELEERLQDEQKQLDTLVDKIMKLGYIEVGDSEKEKKLVGKKWVNDLKTLTELKTRVINEELAVRDIAVIEAEKNIALEMNKFLQGSTRLLYKFLDEALTGKQAFAEKGQEKHIAQYMLSPDEFYKMGDFRNKVYGEKLKILAGKLKFGVRARGRRNKMIGRYRTTSYRVDIMEKIQKEVTETFSPYEEALLTAIETLQQDDKISEGMTDWLRQAWEKVREVFRGFKEKIAGFFGKLEKDSSDLMADEIVDMYENPFDDMEIELDETSETKEQEG